MQAGRMSYYLTFVILLLSTFKVQASSENIAIHGGETHATGSTIHFTIILKIESSTLYYWYYCQKRDTLHCKFDSSVYNLTCASDTELTASYSNLTEKSILWNMTWNKALVDGTTQCHTYVEEFFSRDILFSAWYNVKDCDKDVNIPNCRCQPDRSAKYNETRTCGCEAGSALYQADTKVKGSNTFESTCNEAAQWIFDGDYSCRPTPEVRLVVYETDYLEKKNVTFTCNVVKGNSSVTASTLHIGKFSKFAIKDRSSGNITVTMKPEYNGQAVLCKVSTEYEESESNKTIIMVFFGPHNVTSDGSLFVKSSNNICNITINVKFLANVYVLTVKAVDSNKTVVLNNETMANVSAKSFRDFQMVEENQEILQYLVRYKLMEITEEKTYTINITIGPDCSEKPTTSPSLSLTIIAAIAGGGGGLLLLGIIVIGCLMLKKRNEPGKTHKKAQNLMLDEASMLPEAEKEERTNPLYGTTADIGSNDVYTTVRKANSSKKKQKEKQKSEEQSVKEVRENPIYQSGGSALEEAYAVVEKKKGKEPTTNDQAKTEPAVEEAYSSVDKIKKKVKKKTGTSTLSGKTNSGFSGGLQEESMYSVVDMKTKKTKKGPGEDCTYAAVQKKSKNPTKKDNEGLHGSAENAK